MHAYRSLIAIFSVALALAETACGAAEDALEDKLAPDDGTAGEGSSLEDGDHPAVAEGTRVSSQPGKAAEGEGKAPATSGKVGSKTQLSSRVNPETMPGAIATSDSATIAAMQREDRSAEESEGDVAAREAEDDSDADGNAALDEASALTER